jgi:hypothetical protein
MTVENRNIEIKAYRNEKGEKTCATDFTKGEVCKFLRMYKFGLVPMCSITGNDLERIGGKAHLIPDDNCLVWK